MIGDLNKNIRPIMARPTETELASIDRAIEKLNHGSQFHVSRARFMIAAAMLVAARVEAGENPFIPQKEAA